MAAVDWFAPEVAAPPIRRPPRPRALVPRRRAEGRRLRGGIFWISAFAVLLVGVVALNVAVLRMNMSVNKLNQQQLELQAQNARSRPRSRCRLVASDRAGRAPLGLTPAQAATRATSTSRRSRARWPGRSTRASGSSSSASCSRSPHCSRGRRGSGPSGPVASAMAQVQTKATVVLPAGRGTIFDSMGARSRSASRRRRCSPTRVRSAVRAPRRALRRASSV
jgi:hypothetical protein